MLQSIFEPCNKSLRSDPTRLECINSKTLNAQWNEFCGNLFWCCFLIRQSSYMFFSSHNLNNLCILSFLDMWLTLI